MKSLKVLDIINIYYKSQMWQNTNEKYFVIEHVCIMSSRVRVRAAEPEQRGDAEMEKCICSYFDYFWHWGRTRAEAENNRRKVYIGQRDTNEKKHLRHFFLFPHDLILDPIVICLNCKIRQINSMQRGIWGIPFTLAQSLMSFVKSWCSVYIRIILHPNCG